MNKLLYLNIDKSIKNTNTVDKLIEKMKSDGLTNIFLFGDIYKDKSKYFKILEKLNAIECNVFIQMNPSFLIKYFDKLKEVNKLRRIVVEIDRVYKEEEIDVLKKINEI